MRVLIVGSRSITKFDLSDFIPSDVELIITGGADGVEALAEKYAAKHRISKLIMYPQYKKFGKYAPVKRNELMVDIADKVIVIWDGSSKGAYYTLKYAERTKKEIVAVRYSDENESV